MPGARFGMNPGEAIPQPIRAKENSPPIHRWVAVGKRNESRQGRQNPVLFSAVLFRPSGACGLWAQVNPAINRWAIFGCPCGTTHNRRKRGRGNDAFPRFTNMFLICFGLKNFGVIVNFFGRGLGAHLVVAHDVRGHEHDQFLLHRAAKGSGEEFAEPRDVAQKRDLALVAGLLRLDQPSEDDGGAVAHADQGRACWCPGPAHWPSRWGWIVTCASDKTSPCQWPQSRPRFHSPEQQLGPRNLSRRSAGPEFLPVLNDRKLQAR